MYPNILVIPYQDIIEQTKIFNHLQLLDFKGIKTLLQ